MHFIPLLLALLAGCHSNLDSPGSLSLLRDSRDCESSSGDSSSDDNSSDGDDSSHGQDDDSSSDDDVCHDDDDSSETDADTDTDTDSDVDTDTDTDSDTDSDTDTDTAETSETADTGLPPEPHVWVQNGCSTTGSLADNIIIATVVMIEILLLSALTSRRA